jgi:hypothetical protein
MAAVTADWETFRLAAPAETCPASAVAMKYRTCRNESTIDFSYIRLRFFVFYNMLDASKE